MNDVLYVTINSYLFNFFLVKLSQNIYLIKFTSLVSLKSFGLYFYKKKKKKCPFMVSKFIPVWCFVNKNWSQAWLLSTIFSNNLIRPKHTYTNKQFIKYVYI